jgi:hypothetical protein
VDCLWGGGGGGGGGYVDAKNYEHMASTDLEKILIAPYHLVCSLLSAPFTAGWISARYMVHGHSCL